jgi:transposase
MEHSVGIDVSLELSSLCVLDAAGKVVREAKVASEPEALVAFLRGLGLAIARVGLEAGPLSQWLHDGLREAGYDVVLLETRHVKAALSAMAVKTDRRDARGIAQLLRMGWYRPVHRKSVPSQEVRALLSARKQLQVKAMDLEQTLRGLLRGFGLKVGDISRGKLPARVRELAAGHAMLERIVEPMLTACEAIWCEFNKLHREVLVIVKEDQVCRRLMTVPGVGAVVSLTYRAAVDDPDRFKKSKSVGAFFGLTPKRYQSGETDVSGHITRVGDAAVRTALHDAANVMLSRVTRFSTLKRWAMEVAKRRGMRRAKVALARKLATVLHRIWADGTEFVWGKDPAATAAAAA